MSCIHELEEPTSRRLNASEYILETASLVKELIDNSLDAGATCIEIEISPNTIDFIQVKDNGHGVDPADVDMLARASCTSKIRNYDELSLLSGRYLGFRGMALSCIANLSGIMEIYTRVESQPAGLLLQLSQEGEVMSRVPKAGNPGTTVTIKNFLESLEVRRKEIKRGQMRYPARAKMMVQTYALARPDVRFCYSVRGRGEASRWEHGGGSVIDAARDVFRPSLVSDCMLKHWSSATGFAENEEPDLHLAKGPHFAISALLLKPDIAFGTEHSRGSHCSVDFRPVVSSRGTMKKIVSLYRECLQKFFSGVTNPFLCFNIMCPAGSYDPCIEPAKDDVLFTAEESVLAVVEGFFQAVYGKAIQQRAAQQLTATNLLSLNGDDGDPKPTDQVSEVSNSTTASSFSELTQTEKQGGRERLSLAKSTSILGPSAAGDRFIGISLPIRLSQEQSQQQEDESNDYNHGDREENAYTRNAVNTRSTTTRGLGPIPALPKPPSFPLFNRPVDEDPVENNDLVPSSIYLTPEEYARRRTYHGPMDRYLKPKPRTALPAPIAVHSSSTTGTALADIPVHTSRKRKTIDSTHSEDVASEQTTPSKGHSSSTSLTTPVTQSRSPLKATQARVSFAPTFAFSPQTSSRHNIPSPRKQTRPGLVTPDPSPLKQSHLTLPRTQVSPPVFNPSTQARTNTFTPINPPTPVSSKKPVHRVAVLRISPTISQVERDFHALLRSDGYAAAAAAADTQRYLSGFDVFGLSMRDVEGLVCRTERRLQDLGCEM